MSVDSIQRKVSVTGVGRVAAAADLLVLNLAVEIQAVTASDALAENNKQAAAVLAALKDHDIQARDVQTTQLSIDPVMARQDPNDTQPPRIIGYRVRNGLSATLRDVPAAGAVIDAVVHAGGDAIRIEGISFSFADPARLLAEARKRAIDDARDRAQQLVGGLGVELGNVISISESDLSGGPVPRVFAAAAGIIPGESEVTLWSLLITRSPRSRRKGPTSQFERRIPMTESAPAPAPTPQGGSRSGDQNAPRPQVSRGVLRGGRARPIFVHDSRSGDSPCYVVSRFDGLHIREHPDKNSRSDGRLDQGQALPASCEARRGRYYDDCDGSDWWIPVPYEGRTDYVAWACVDWYTSDTGDDGPGFG